MTSWSKKLFKITAVAAITLVTAYSAQASDYPTKPIKVIVPYGAGGDSDLSARIWADAMEKELGSPVVVINKTGGGGVIATTFVANSKPDGYTLAQVGLSTILVSPNFSKTPYTLDSFTPIVKMISQPLAIAVKADSPYKTFDDFVTAAKEKTVTVGSWGAASSGTILSNIIADQKGYKPKYVHGNTTAESMVSVVGGHIDAAITFPPAFLPHLKTGRARVLAINKKIDAYPEIPTFADYGVKGDFEGWGGFFAPKGTPEEVITKLINASEKIMKEPEVLKAIANIGVNPDFRYGEEWIEGMRAASETMKETAAKMKE